MHYYDVGVATSVLVVRMLQAATQLGTKFKYRVTPCSCHAASIVVGHDLLQNADALTLILGQVHAGLDFDTLCATRRTNKVFCACTRVALAHRINAVSMQILQEHVHQHINAAALQVFLRDHMLDDIREVLWHIRKSNRQQQGLQLSDEANHSICNVLVNQLNLDMVSDACINHVRNMLWNVLVRSNMGRNEGQR